MVNLNNWIKAALVILVAIIVTASVGGNGCAWVGDGKEAASGGGSSGALIGTSPSPANGAINVSIATTRLSWVSATGPNPMWCIGAQPTRRCTTAQ